MEEIVFTLSGQPYIELIKLLKAVGIVRSGAVAKEAVASGGVLRDGVQELRKRAKIRAGEKIEWDRFLILVTA